MSFNFFYDNWLNYSNLLDFKKSLQFEINLSIDFFRTLKFDKTSVHNYIIEGAIECAKTLGDNPALCLSGGLDSQLMVLAFNEAGYKFKSYTLEFNDDLNDQDFLHAKLFCEKNKIDYNPIKFNVINFLNRENYNVGIKYKSASPHFNVHYQLFNILKNMGHTGVCCGGLYPLNNVDDWGGNFLPNNLNYINYSLIENFFSQGNFLSFYHKTAWALALNSKPTNDFTFSVVKGYQEKNLWSERYIDKINLFNNLGFNVIPQDNKYTGFEKVKIYYKNLHNDEWFFEKNFRFPLANKFVRPLQKNRFILTKEQYNCLSDIYSNNLSSC